MAFDLQQHRELTQVETKQDSSLGIMRWGKNNTFPQTLKNLIEQSPIAKSATSRTAKFYKGEGFIQEDMVVTPYGLTLGEVVNIMADDLSTFDAYALHANFNLQGEVTSIAPLRIAELRFNEFDELNFASKVGYHQNFGMNSEVQKTVHNSANRGNIKWFDRFNPDAVLEQIIKTKGGAGNYQGQVLYYSGAGHSSYPIPTLQAPINYMLSDIENSILVRKEVATGFVNTYVLKTMMDAEENSLIQMENALSLAQGARGSGKIVTFAGLSEEEVKSTLLEEVGSGGAGSKAVIESAQLSFELSQKVILGAYLIPPVLAGADQKNGFSGTALDEAYYVYNAITQEGRDALEKGINRLLSHSIYMRSDISIKRLKLDVDEVIEEEIVGDTRDNITNMTPKQMQHLTRIKRNFQKGNLNASQAELMLKQSFGFSDEEIEVWLTVDEPKEDEKKKEDE